MCGRWSLLNGGSEDVVLNRMVVVGGQGVSIRDSLLDVDGWRVDEPGSDASIIDGIWSGPVAIPEGAVFVLGDNRAASIDSRGSGSIARDEVRGKVLLSLGTLSRDFSAPAASERPLPFSSVHRQLRDRPAAEGVHGAPEIQEWCSELMPGRSGAGPTSTSSMDLSGISNTKVADRL